MTLVELILIALATARLTRLVTSDILTGPPRDALLRRILVKDTDVRSKLAYLLVCDWCASMYTGAATVGAWLAWHGNMWFMGALAVLAASYVTGALNSTTGGE